MPHPKASQWKKNAAMPLNSPWLHLSDSDHEHMAECLYQAAMAGKAIDPPSDTIQFGFQDAYRIRRKLVDRHIANGARPRGHKIGFTSAAKQKMYGMTAPDFGILLDRMFRLSGAPIKISGMADTRAEPELAFILGRPLSGPGATIADVLAATSKIVAAVEVIDSRVGAMRARAHDSLADNAGAGLVVLGALAFDPDKIDFESLWIDFTVDGARSAALATEVMGHPAAPLAWLANKLPELGELGGNLKPGDVVITGAPVQSVPVRPGSRVQADFGPLGLMKIEFE